MRTWCSHRKKRKLSGLCMSQHVLEFQSRRRGSLEELTPSCTTDVKARERRAARSRRSRPSASTMYFIWNSACLLRMLPFVTMDLCWRRQSRRYLE